MSALVAALAGGGELTLARPWALLLAPVLLGWVLLAARRPPPALGWPALEEAAAAGARGFDVVRALGLALRAGALLVLLVVLAGPMRTRPDAPSSQLGLDLVLVVDASGSMRALDADIGGKWQQRLELARAVVRRFALHRVADGDRVGLVVFGDSAFTLCPLTRDGALLAAALDRLEAGMAGEATALGDALALAVKRVQGRRPRSEPEASEVHEAGRRPRSEPARPKAAQRAEGERSSQEASEVHKTGPIAGQLVVLLTDGRTNAGSVPPDLAAALAAAAGIRVHTVGIGGSGAVAMAAPKGGRELRLERHDLDLATLRTIAAATGGRAFETRSAADLDAVYAEIDALERVPQPAPPRREGEPVPEPFLAAAGALLLAAIAAERVLGRRLP